MFYYLTEGAPAALRSKLKLQGCDSYRYLQHAHVSDPANWFSELDKSLRVLEFTEDEIMSLWTALAAILKTGEIDFKDIADSTDDSCTFADRDVALDLAEALGVDIDTLENALTTKHVVIVGETNHKPLNAALAAQTRDTLAQNMVSIQPAQLTMCRVSRLILSLGSMTTCFRGSWINSTASWLLKTKGTSDQSRFSIFSGLKTSPAMNSSRCSSTLPTRRCSTTSSRLVLGRCVIVCQSLTNFGCFSSTSSPTRSRSSRKRAFVRPRSNTQRTTTRSTC